MRCVYVCVIKNKYHTCYSFKLIKEHILLYVSICTIGIIPKYFIQNFFPIDIYFNYMSYHKLMCGYKAHHLHELVYVTMYIHVIVCIYILYTQEYNCFVWFQVSLNGFIIVLLVTVKVFLEFKVLKSTRI